MEFRISRISCRNAFQRYWIKWKTQVITKYLRFLKIWLMVLFFKYWRNKTSSRRTSINLACLKLSSNKLSQVYWILTRRIAVIGLILQLVKAKSIKICKKQSLLFDLTCSYSNWAMTRKSHSHWQKWSLNSKFLRKIQNFAITRLRNSSQS